MNSPYLPKLLFAFWVLYKALGFAISLAGEARGAHTAPADSPGLDPARSGLLQWEVLHDPPVPLEYLREQQFFSLGPRWDRVAGVSCLPARSGDRSGQFSVCNQNLQKPLILYHQRVQPGLEPGVTFSVTAVLELLELSGNAPLGYLLPWERAFLPPSSAVPQ